MFRFGFHRKKKRPASPQVPVLITATPAKAHSLTPADEAIHIQLDQVLAWAMTKEESPEKGGSMGQHAGAGCAAG